MVSSDPFGMQWVGKYVLWRIGKGLMTYFLGGVIPLSEVLFTQLRRMSKRFDFNDRFL